MNDDLFNWRPSDPETSRHAPRYLDFKRQRAIDWQLVLDIRHRQFENDFKALLDAESGLYIVTRKLIGVAYGLVFPGKILESGRRRGSDLVCQQLKAGRLSPRVHFDLLCPIPGPDGQPLEFEGSELLALTKKGLAWERYPSCCDWRWPARPWVDLDE
jgi:hypothetical protein